MTALSRAWLACILMAGVSQGCRHRQHQGEAQLNITNGTGGSDWVAWRSTTPVAASDDIHSSGPLQRRQGHSSASDTRDSVIMHGVDTVAPFVIKDAIVLDLVDPAELRGEDDAGDQSGLTAGARALMMMQRKPVRLAVCNQCSIRRCRGHTCSGRCRKLRKVYNCRSQLPRAAPPIVPVGGGNPPSCALYGPNDPFPPTDKLPLSDSLVVTAPAPFIGCAHIAGRAAGIACPAAGTRGTMHGGGASSGTQYEVTSSTCYRKDYCPRCYGDPYYPLGVCLCTKRALSGQDLGTGACDVSELELTGPHGTAEVPVGFEDRGGSTYTGISDYTEPFDEPQFTNSVRVRVTTVQPPVDVTVSLEIYAGLELYGYYQDEVGVVSDDYY